MDPERIWGFLVRDLQDWLSYKYEVLFWLINTIVGAVTYSFLGTYVGLESPEFIAKYGGSWRGIKPKVAAEHGAVGCLIFSDPEDKGYGTRSGLLIRIVPEDGKTPASPVPRQSAWTTSKRSGQDRIQDRVQRLRVPENEDRQKRQQRQTKRHRLAPDTDCPKPHRECAHTDQRDGIRRNEQDDPQDMAAS